MKRNTIIACNLSALYLILAQFGVWNALMLFILVGALPGTQSSIAPQIMFAVFGVVLIGAAAETAHRADTAHHDAKQPLPKKRYGRV